MKILYILEAKWLDKIGRTKKNYLVGVYDCLNKLETAKKKIQDIPHQYHSVSFGIKSEIQPFHA